MKTSFFCTAARRTAPLAALGAPAAALAQQQGAAQQGGSTAFGGVLGALALIVLLAVLWGLLRRVQRLRAAAQRKAAPPPPQYKPDKVGNDASARPWEGATEERLQDAADGARIPDGFDTAAFLGAAKDIYIRVQYARSNADQEALRALMDADTFAQEQAQPVGAPASEVPMLEARLLGVVREGEGEAASVEFSGMAGGGTAGGYAPFHELWSLARATAGQGAWRVAGIQALSV